MAEQFETKTGTIPKLSLSAAAVANIEWLRVFRGLNHKKFAEALGYSDIYAIMWLSQAAHNRTGHTIHRTLKAISRALDGPQSDDVFNRPLDEFKATVIVHDDIRRGAEDVTPRIGENTDHLTRKELFGWGICTGVVATFILLALLQFFSWCFSPSDSLDVQRAHKAAIATPVVALPKPVKLTLPSAVVQVSLTPAPERIVK